MCQALAANRGPLLGLATAGRGAGTVSVQRQGADATGANYTKESDSYREVVAKGGIEPPTHGFSVLPSHPTSLIWPALTRQEP